jgi:hypothetical protein
MEVFMGWLWWYCYFHGIGVRESEEDGILHLGTAPAQGSNAAAQTLGKTLAKGRLGLKVDKDEAIRWLKKSLSRERMHKLRLEKTDAQDLLDELVNASQASALEAPLGSRNRVLSRSESSPARRFFFEASPLRPDEVWFTSIVWKRRNHFRYQRVRSHFSFLETQQWSCISLSGQGRQLDSWLLPSPRSRTLPANNF